ncbi:SurA N-terminal domain-containing protein [Candidatus Woesearchaeota archaeon]|nr:SurA N-terminal domain-containing protein [Candidatus Woesearchaeota archaeon]
MAKAKRKNNGNMTSAKSLKGSRRKPSKIRLILAIIIILAGLGLVFAALTKLVPGLLGGASLSGQLAATVNGEEITMMDLDQAYDGLSEQYQYFMTKEDYLSQMIDQVLLKQEAVKRGVTVTDDEADQNLKSFLLQNGITAEELTELLENQSINYEELIRISKEQLLIQKLFEQEIRQKVNVSDEEVLAYYENNSEQFIQESTTTLRHILFSVNYDNKTLSETRDMAESVLDLVAPDKSNFCDLAAEYSDDVQSKDDCGEYEFPTSQLPTEFQVWAENTNMGGVGIVETDFGTHVVMLIDQTTEPESLPFEDVKDQIVAALRSQKERDAFADFLSGVRDSATIVNYLEEREEANESEAISGDAIFEYEEVAPVPEGVEEEASEVAPEETLPADEVAEPVVEEEIVVEEPVAEETVAEEIVVEEPVVEETEAATNTEVTILSDDDLIACLADKKATLYGAAWDSSTAKQKALFGDDISKFEYVECADPADYRKQTEICETAGILAYPTWRIEGVNYLGIYTVKQLADLAGC